jgi:hypothetical protein
MYASLRNTCRTAGSDKLNALYIYEYSEGPDQIMAMAAAALVCP